MLTSVSAIGELKSRPMLLGSINDDGTVQVLIDVEDAWVDTLRPGDPVNVAVVRDDRQTWVSVSGFVAGVESDSAAVDRLWTGRVQAYVGDDPNAETLRVLSISPAAGEYWDLPDGRLSRLAAKARSLIGQESPGSESLEFR
jgi:general stress protein 26